MTRIVSIDGSPRVVRSRYMHGLPGGKGSKGDLGDPGPQGPPGPAPTVEMTHTARALDARKGMVWDYTTWSAGVFDPEASENQQWGAPADLTGTTFARATERRALGADGRFVATPPGDLAPAHDVNGRLIGARFAPATTNVADWSNDFSNYGQTGVTLTPGVAGSVIDAETSTRIAQTATTENHQIVRNFGALQAGTRYCMWAVVAPDGQDIVRLYLPAGPFSGGQPRVEFEFSTETIDLLNADEGGFRRLPNGRVLIWMTAEADTTVAGTSIVRLGRTSEPGSVTNAIHLDHIQINDGPRPGPVVTTAGAPVTHAADDCTFAIPPGYFNGPFSLFFRARTAWRTGATRRLLEVGNGANQRINVYLSAETEQLSMFTNLGSTSLQRNFMLAAEGDPFAVGLTIGHRNSDGQAPHTWFVNGAPLGAADEMLDFDPALLTEVVFGNWYSGLSSVSDVEIEQVTLLPYAAGSAEAIARTTL